MKRKINWLMVVVFICGFFNINPYNYFWMDDEEGQIAYAQPAPEAPVAEEDRATAQKKIWTFLNADLTGQNVSWKTEWTDALNGAKATLDTAQFGCLEVSGVEDVTPFGGTAEVRAAGGQDPLRAVRARARASYMMNKLMEIGVNGNRIREGTMFTRAQEGQRGAIIRLVEDCLPKPSVQCWDSNENYKCDGDEDVNKDTKCDVMDCRGDDGEAKVNITYDLVGQYLWSPERDNFVGAMLRVNFPVSESWTIGVGAQYGKANEVGAAGFELNAEYDWKQWIKPHFCLIGRTFDLDTHMYFGRGEVGGGVGFVGELAKLEGWSFIYEMRGELKGDVEDRRGWQMIKSGAGNFGVRF